MRIAFSPIMIGCRGAKLRFFHILKPQSTVKLKRIENMKRKRLERFLWLVGVVLLMGATTNPAVGGMLRITMNDGSSVEVPYYWEANNELKFEIAGGVAGIQKSQVRSVQEVVTSNEFDPEEMIESTQSQGESDQRDPLHALILTDIEKDAGREKLSTEESLRLLSLIQTKKSGSERDPENVRAPSFEVKAEIAEMVQTGSSDPVLVLRNVVSTPVTLDGTKFILSLYDSNGAVVKQHDCEVRELNVSQKDLNKYGIRGHLYSIKASVQPDPKIKRYEIVLAKH
jgi:hypothetical protein